MIKEYGTALYSIAVDLDLGCPNRSSDGSGGCTFCPVDGARATQAKDAKSVEEQIIKGIAFAKKRYKATKFMLYLQAYTSTFTSIIRQKKIYSHLLKQHDFDAISIGTRPDCLNTSTLEYLRELNKEIDVHVDLGVQTLNDVTLIKINREHDASCSLEGIKKLQAYGLKVFAHVIVGLEGETRADWEHTVKTLVACKVDGIKIHHLHVIKNTPMAKEYAANPFKTLSEYEYAEELIHLLRLIPSHIPILRIATDTPDKDLIAPIWHMAKGQFAEYIAETMQYRFGKSDVDENFWSKKYNDYYYPKSGAIRQAKELFIEKSELQKRLTCKNIKLLDIGFGLGVNSLEALNLEKEFSLHVSALDQDRSIINKEGSPILKKLYEEGFYSDVKNSIKFIVGDIRYTLTKLDEKFDVIFLDPFLETLNPSMISLEVFTILKDLLKQDGVLVCSTSFKAVRVALSLVGFKSEMIHIPNSDIKGVVARHGKEYIQGEPYRDPYLVFRDKQIVTNRY
jgi:radical SAM protein (TIGR01212 family)